MSRFLMGVVFVLSVAGPTRAGDPPADLAVIPGDAAGFVSIDVPAVLKSPLVDDARWAFDGLAPGEFTALARRFPLDPATVRRVVVILPTAATAVEPVPDGSPTAVSALVVATCDRPFDPDAVRKGVFPAGRPKTYRGRTYQFDEDSWSGALVLPGHRSLVVGAEDALVWLVNRLDKGVTPGPLAAARGEADGHAMYAAVSPRAVLPPAVVPPPFRPLVDAERWAVTADFRATAAVAVRLEYADAGRAAAGEQAVHGLVDLLREQVRGKHLELMWAANKPDTAGGSTPVGEFPARFGTLLGAGALRRIDHALGAMPVVRAGATVRLAADVPVAGHSAVLLGIAGVTTLGSNASSTFTFVGNRLQPGGAVVRPEEERLKKLAAAFEAYHAEHGHYPPAAVAGTDGSPLLSWRVALLPYLGERELYKQFRLDEPWDSLHNKTLIARMPAAYNKSSFGKPGGKTNARVVTGRGTLFDGPAGVRKGGFPPGRGVLAVETHPDSGVYWTKPDELPAAPGRPPAVFGPSPFGSCWVLLADGTVKSLTRKDDEARLPALLTRDGGK